MKKSFAFILAILVVSSSWAKGSSSSGRSSFSSSKSSFSSSKSSSSWGSSKSSNSFSHSAGESWTTPGGRKVTGQPKLYNGTPSKNFTKSKTTSSSTVRTQTVYVPVHTVTVVHEDRSSFFDTFWHPMYFWLPWNWWHSKPAASAPSTVYVVPVTPTPTPGRP